jgi:sulfur carrier protein ThiS
VLEKVSESDVTTLADVLRRLEFPSMLVASKVMSEVGTRHLWPTVIDR